MKKGFDSFDLWTITERNRNNRGMDKYLDFMSASKGVTTLFSSLSFTVPVNLNELYFAAHGFCKMN